MVSSQQMALFIEMMTKAGAKLVLVGDPEQLQPIEAGAAFRPIADRIGYAELETIYRQRQQWIRTRRSIWSKRLRCFFILQSTLKRSARPLNRSSRSAIRNGGFRASTLQQS
jgi:ATP-dependent exoDNAse (exonuclease V) alpha subunit